MRNYLTIAGKDSRDFGVYISGQGTFSAPAKGYEFYNVPGRNGAILGNDNRLENIEVTYECFIYTDFDENIAEFRTFILSLDGYQELTDSYHPDEYRLAAYQGPFEPEVVPKNDAGSFSLTFNCKPQRFLYSGETVYSYLPNGTQQTISGSVLNVYAPRLSRSHLSATVAEHMNTVYDWDLYGSTTDLGGFDAIDLYVNKNNMYRFPLGQNCTGAVCDIPHGSYYIYQTTARLDSMSWAVGDASIGIFQTSTATQFNILINCSHYQVYNVSSAADISEARTMLNQYDRGIAIYNGTILLKESRLINATLSDFEAWITNVSWYGHDYGAVSVDGLLATYIFGTISDQYVLGNYPGFILIEVKPHNSSNYVRNYTISTNIQASYDTQINVMSNPTMFQSSPLIRAYGNGSFKINDITVTITNATSYTDIDCDIMDCYEGSTNRNKDVTFSTYDFPKLNTGDNEVTIVSGITAVEITPRWWRV